MKVKSLLLSMCAIAALAGCSQNDDEIPGGGSNTPEARVIIKLAGSGERASSRATGVLGDDTSNGTVNDLTVFIFNKDGVVITKSYIDSPTSPGANNVTTTTDATEVAVIANTGNLTTSGKLFANVATKTALKAVLTDILATPDTPAGVITQKDNNLYMSGISNLEPFEKQGDGSMKIGVTVQLHFLAARIQLTKITFNGKAVNDNKYVQNSNFATTDDANFTIERVYLMSVQRMTQFLPTTDNGSDYIAQGQKKYTGGVTWTEPWKAPSPNEFKQYNEYTIEAGTDKFVEGTATAKSTITDIGHWYTFTNDGVSAIADYPTALVVQVKWRQKMATKSPDPVADAVNQTMYFTTYFGGGDKKELQAGKTYSVVLNLNGNFKPENQGGSGGGGTTDPTKPTVNSSVDVTVTAANWDTPIDISKEWI